MPQQKLRIALIGLGDIAQKAYLPMVTTHPQVAPLLCTRNADTLAELSSAYRVAERYTALEEVITQRPDAAMVHSATEAHPDQIEQLLRAGIPTFVDKPVAYTLADTERLFALAETHNVPLFVGFNRRYAPLIHALRERPDPRRLHWAKQRTNQPGAPRTFVLDDFVHVLDGLRYLAPGPVTDLQVHARHATDGQLAHVAVRWTQGECLVTGEMNRLSGRTEETVEYFTPGNTWRIQELHYGTHYADGTPHPLGFGNWTPTLEQRGFTDMLEHWLRVARTGTFDAAYAEDMLATHALCEAVLDTLS